MRIDGTKYKNGFTLIELSIVLIIIGFIVAGVLTGRSLIRQSQVNSANTDVQRYISATINFRQKYGSLPGDMPNATTYWGPMVTCPPASTSIPANNMAPVTALTCNGNGNGTLDLISSNYYEEWYFWQHLANAQLIEGPYNGSPSSLGSKPGLNVPTGRLPGLGYSIWYAVNLDQFFCGPATAYNCGHVIFMGGVPPGGYIFADGGILTTLEAQSFDSKYDDGQPATGSVRGLQYGYTDTPYCTTTAVATTALYNTSPSNGNSTGFQCSLAILTGF